jgi:hypothetical protein
VKESIRTWKASPGIGVAEQGPVPVRPREVLGSKRMKVGKRRLDGNHVIYHYLQKVVAARDDEFSRTLIEHLIVDLSIWVHPRAYRALPILLPFCLRDPSCRTSGPGGADEWGSATVDGYLRDDNSLLKAVAPSLDISSPRFATYDGGRASRGFVASHVWREVEIDGARRLASVHPRLYSFIPNFAWLPAQVAKLTDREGSYAQRVLQSLSHRIYSQHRSGEPTVIRSLWDALPNPGLTFTVDPSQLNYFLASEEWLQRRKRAMSREIAAILAVLRGSTPSIEKVKCSRYLPSLRQSNAAWSGLGHWLETYARIAGLDSSP